VSRLSYKTLFIILLFLLIPIVFLLRINQKSKNVSAAWWNDSWMYRVPINIGNSQSSQTNIQVKILNDYDLSALITVEKIQTSLDDLRFIDINGELISYWIEDPTENSVDIWGIIPSLPSGGTTIYMYYGNPSASAVSSTSNMTIGGTMTFVDGFRIHTFKNSGTLANISNTNVEILVVAGGGGGAAMTGGGGGAGGLIYDPSFPLTPQNYSVTVGLGGSGQIGTANPGNGSDGQNSIFDTLIAIGGGGGGTNSGVGRSGGSGGGAGHNNTIGGVGTSGQGNNGSGGNTTAPNYGAGGGGGAGAVGDTPTNYAGGNGGIGIAYSISGTSQYYAGGGGGGTYQGGTYGLGGTGGGGNAPAGNATPNTGGGGGGQINNLPNGGNGGSGIVILRYSSGIINPPGIEELRPQAGVNIGGTSIETPPGNLVAYYKFDEGHGLVVNNSGIGGSSANGTLASGTSSPVWVNDGKINKSLNFNNNNYINLPNTLGYTNTVSAFAWFKSNGTPTGNYHIIMGGQELEISIPVSGQIRTGVFTNTRYVSNHGSGLLDNQWHHVGFTFDGSTKKSYIDGQFVGQQTGIGGTLRSSFTGRTIGKFGTSNVYFLNGYLDEVKIFDYPLSEDEIKREYNQSASIIFSVDKVNVGNTSVSALYCVPGSTDPCSPPVAEWKFDEEVGTTAYDTSGNNINLRTYNATPTVGKIGRALNFNSSSNSYLISSSDPGVMSSGTYSLWVKPSTINANMGWIDSNFDIFQWTGNSLYFRAGNQSSVSISNWSTDTWHHLSLTWNGSNYYGYIDGKEVTSGVQSGSRSGLINLGRVDNNYYFDGSIDQIRIYNYARTPAQIAWDYNQGAPVAHYKLDECQGTTIHDSSDNANHGTLSIGASGTQNTLGTCTVGTSAAWTNGATGKINSSLSFDGTDDYAYINQVNLSNTDKMSLSFWLKFSGNSLKIISEYSNNFNSNNSFLIDHSEFGIPGSLQISDHTPSGYNISYTSKAYNDNQWHHFVSTIDRSLGINQNKIYIDGKEDNILHTSHRTDLSGNFGGPFTLYLSSRAGNSYFFPGLIDDVRIYNYALTPDQIKQIYNSGAINFN